MKTIIRATIKWLDNQQEEEVIFKVGDVEEDTDDDVFYYLDSWEHIHSLMEEGIEDFVVQGIVEVEHEVKSYSNIYICGRGLVSISAGHIKSADESIGGVCIEFSDLEDPKETGTNVLGYQGSNFTHVRFESLEALEVLQKAVDRCREILTINK